jgi:hypothetical protein
LDGIYPAALSELKAYSTPPAEIFAVFAGIYKFRLNKKMKNWKDSWATSFTAQMNNYYTTLADPTWLMKVSAERLVIIEKETTSKLNVENLSKKSSIGAILLKALVMAVELAKKLKADAEVQIYFET